MEAKRTGFIRRYDENGRISPPSEWMKELGIFKGDKIEIILCKDYIAIRKVIEDDK